MNKPLLSLQEIFDIMVQGLSAQNWEQSIDPSSSSRLCMYRQGCKRCAVGHLFSPLFAEDDPIWRTQGDVQTLLDARPDALGFQLQEGQLDFLKDAQTAHDTAPDYMKHRFQQLAEKYGLLMTA